MTVELNHRIDGSGPHVLLLHAVGMDLTLLDALAAIMAQDFTVLRADLRGHGKSPYVPAASLADYADDVHALLAKLSFAPVRGRGLRDGRHGHAGARREIPAGHARADDRLVRASSRRRRAAPRCCRAPTEREARRLCENPRRDDAALVHRRLHRARRRCGGAPAAARRQCRRVGRTRSRRWPAIDTAPQLKYIKVPTLCLVGDADKSTPPPVVKAIADAIPGARFTVHSRRHAHAVRRDPRRRSRRWWVDFSRRC